MAIKKVEKVTVNGSDKIFGGVIYSARYSPSFSDAASRIHLTVVNESRQYREPRLSARIPYRVKIGNILHGDFYAVSYKEDDSPQGKVLDTVFVDGSFILDKITIGLHKRYGIIPAKIEDRRKYSGRNQASFQDEQERFNSAPDNPKFEEKNKYEHYYIQRDERNKPTNLIIIGQEFHPCDRDLDGVIDFEKDGEFDKDSCDPCPNCPEDKYGAETNRTRCEDISCTQIFEVKYNFRTLIAALTESLSNSNIKISINNDLIPDTNDDYYASYEGSARDVLKEWCADYGYNFYCEMNSSTMELEIGFIDVKNPIDIILPEHIKNQAVSENIKEKSIEETLHRASISLFEKEGEVKDYPCTREDMVTLQPLTLRDIYSRASNTTQSLAQDIKSSSLTEIEVSCSLMRINSNIRDLFWFLNHYQIEDHIAAIKCLYQTFDLEQPKLVDGDWDQRGLTSPWTGIKTPSNIGSIGTAPNSNRDEKWKYMSISGARELGGLKIYAVVHPDGISYSKAPDGEVTGPSNAMKREIIPVSDGGAAYKRLVSQMNSQDASRFRKVTLQNRPNEVGLSHNESVPDYIRDLTDKSHYPGYFLVVEQSDSILSSIHDIEKRVANEFMGRYFYRKLDLKDKYRSCSETPGGVKDKKNFSINCETPDGSGQVVLFGKDESFRGLPIFNFGHTDSSPVGKILRDMEKSFRVKNVDKRDPAYVEEEYEYEEALVLVERDAKWFPPKEDTPSYEKIVEYYNSRMFLPIGSGRGDEVSWLINEYVKDKTESDDIKVIACFPCKMEININSLSTNPLDTKGRVPVASNVEKGGCGADCSNGDKCFSGEKNPKRLNSLKRELLKLEQKGKKGTVIWSKIHREIHGDICVGGDCKHKECNGFDDCSNVITIVKGRPIYDKGCLDGKCVDMIGLRSNICMEMNVSGLKILTPSQACGVSTSNTISFTEEGLQDMYSAKGYDCMLVQNYTQRVTIPKIQNIVQEDISEDGETFRYEINFMGIPFEDISLMSGEICRPNPEIINKAHEKFNKDMTFSVTQPFETHTFTILDINLVSDKDVSIRNGLTSLDVTIGSSGVSTSYTFSNKVAQPIRVDLLKREIELNRKRKTNVIR